MKKITTEAEKVVTQLKTARKQFQDLLKNKGWINDAKKYAESQGKEVRKMFTSDLKKVKTFIDKEKKELDKFQKQIPGEIKKFRKYVEKQKTELEKLVKTLSKNKKLSKGKKTATKRKPKADVVQAAEPMTSPTQSTTPPQF